MNQILEYISQNYVWFLGIAILIVLAIIGYYADKTNFGQGKNSIDSNEQKAEKTEKLDNNLIGPDAHTNEFNIENYNLMREDEPLEEKKELNNENQNQTNSQNFEQFETQSSEIFETNSQVNNAVQEECESDILNNRTEENSVILSEEEINKFNDEFELILPKKELMDTDLIDDIDDLSLDKTQKIDLGDIPSLEDIELPKIKPLSTKEDDIWKF